MSNAEAHLLSRHARVAAIAAAVLVVLGASELATHQARDAASYSAGYSAAVSVAGFGPGALTDSHAGATMCDHLLRDAMFDDQSPRVDQGDFRDGCNQAVRDAAE